MRATRRRRLASLGAGLTLLVLAAGIAYAAAPTTNGTISGCYDRANGQLRLSDEHCLPSENPISWNTQGVPGPAGPTFARVNGGSPVLQSGMSNLVTHDVTTPTSGALYVTGSVDVDDMSCDSEPFCVAYFSLWVDGAIVAGSGSRFVIHTGETRQSENVNVYGVTSEPTAAGSHTVELRVSTFNPVGAVYENARTAVILLGES